MKVLHVFKAMELGGVPTFVLELTRSLVQLGVHCEIAAADGLRSFNDSKPHLHLPMHLFPSRFPACWWPCYSPKLSQFLHEEAHRFDLVHIHGLWNHASYAAFRAARRHGISYVLSPHSALEEWTVRQYARRKRVYMSIIQKPILKFASALHCISDAEQSDAARWGVDTPVFTVPPGIPHDFADAVTNVEPSGFLSCYPSLVDKRIILFVGRLAHIKGLDILSRAFSSVVVQFPKALLLVVGPEHDGEGDKIKAEMEPLQNQGRAVLTGSLPACDLLAAYSCAEIFILPSRSEGFGIVALEAMMAGLPVVVSDRCRGISSMIRDANAGLVVPLGEKQLADAMVSLLSDKPRAARLAQNGQRMAMNCTWPAAAQCMATHYSDIIDKQRGRQDVVSS